MLRARHTATRSPYRYALAMSDAIRHPCFDSALPGYAQHKRWRVRPERSVATFGEQFLRGVSGTFPIPGFPCPRENKRLRWEQSLQNSVIVP